LGTNTYNFDHFETDSKKEIPLTFFDRTNNNLNVGQVLINNFESAYEVTYHLINQGYKNIVHFTSELKIKIYEDRYQVYRQALRDNGIKFDKNSVVEGNLQLKDTQQSTRFLLDNKKHFDAIFSASDHAMVGALQELVKNNLRIPEDVDLMESSNEPYTAFTIPPLSIVDQNVIKMGEHTASLLFDRLNNNQTSKSRVKKTLDATLIIRASSQKTIIPN
jgi:LacI family transcriptional regulator